MIVPKKNASWFSLLLQFKGTIYERIRFRLWVVVIFSCVVTAIYETLDTSGEWFSMTPFSLIGVALGIFLGFRNNTSYDRFWEGRKLWGGVVNTSRTLTRRILTLIDEDEPTANHRRVMMIAGYVHLLRQHLRHEWNPSEVEHLLDAQVIERLQGENNRPIALLQHLGDDFRTGYQNQKIHPYHLSHLEDGLTDFTNLQGGCERIRSTPIPFSYNVLLHRIVAIYCFTLSFGLAPKIDWFTPIVVAFIGYAFLGIDAIGEEIEEPFGLDANDLPLNALSTMIEANILQRLDSETLPELKTPNPITRILD